MNTDKVTNTKTKVQWTIDNEIYNNFMKNFNEPKRGRPKKGTITPAVVVEELIRGWLSNKVN